MTSPLAALSRVEVGGCLRQAREAVPLTQAEAAKEAQLARTTLVAIEKGQRPVRVDELRALARIYRTTVNALLRNEAVKVDLTPKFRKLDANDSTAVSNAAKLLSDLVKAEVELENLLGVQRRRNYPPERPLLPGDVRAQAEHDAVELRQWLGLGMAPVADIVSLLELELGVRVYVRRLEGKVSGLFAYDDTVGACILLNANHPKDRRTQTGSHEIGHLLATRRTPEVLELDEADNSREERYANAFGAAFLMPARAVLQKFSEVTAGSEKLTRRHVIVLAHAFGVSREAVVRRLEDLKLTKVGTWDWFEQNGGISDAQARQVLGDVPLQDVQKSDADRPVSLRLALLADEAWRQELLSEGQLAQLLHIDRVEFRRMIDGLAIEGNEADGALIARQ
jgi:Zn-dependent peptidase ImmA (M78 family)/DNA-binding XRE family transcriptional regulator